MNKTAIKNFAIWARNKLIADITYKAGLLGITAKEIKSPLTQSTQTVQFFDIGTKDPSSITSKEIEQRKKLVEEIQRKAKQSDYSTAYKNVIEEVAYTWFNRLIAIRFMEVNDYLPTRIRVLSSEGNGKTEPDLVTHALEASLDYSAYEKDRIMQLKHENKLDDLFRMLFIKQCNALSANLPELFEKMSDYTELLLNVSFTDKDGVVYHLINDISEDDFNVSKEGQVEIIGWLYQYYNTEPKDETFALLKKNVKITKERIPAATQLFTPDWIVRYMVENSLGRLWVDGHPNEELKSNWKYYLDEAEQEEDVQKQLEKIREEYNTIKPEDIKVIDPAMGSGHILVYAFDVLMQIYGSQGYSQRDAAKSIVEKNLYGLDIDNRAYQLAYFAVMMKARQFNRRILNGETICRVYTIQESNDINRNQLKYFGAGLSEMEKNTALLQMHGLLDTFIDSKEYGSILYVENYNWQLLRKFIKSIDANGQMALDTIGIEHTSDQMYKLVEIGEVMAHKYNVVLTNPPYMGLRNMSPKLFDYVMSKHPMTKNDLFGVFIQICIDRFCDESGFVSMISQHVWMFTSGFEKFRSKLYLEHSISSLAHLGTRAFDDIAGEVVQTCTFVFRKRHIENYRAKYSRLVNYNTSSEKERNFIERTSQYECSTENFIKIPGIPVCYWLSKQIIDAFEKNPLVGDVSNTRQGLKTSDDKRFIRLHFEVNKDKIAGFVSSINEATQSGKKWFWLNKGGQVKWFGNNVFLINWENDGKEVKDYAAQIAGSYSKNITAIDSYFKKCLSWPQISISHPAFRYIPDGYIFASAGPSLFVNNDNQRWYFLGLLNSCVTQNILDAINPTINFGVSDILKVPFIQDQTQEDRINTLVESCVKIAEEDWNMFEMSWDFQRHPLVYGCNSVEIAYIRWKEICENRFKKLKSNEIELNRIFIDIYGLQNELSPEIQDNDLSISRADYERDMRSLISYAVGCIFGRYSLDKDGLIYAGGDWDNNKYSSFAPDKDNILPVTDEEYLNDDIVGLFVAFVKKAFGKDTLEQNLDFIANALARKGSSSREVIRYYFLNDFFKDHCSTYSVTGSGKRPIYWLFDSGKQNGFKALVYMHRYDENTIGDLRIDYLHRMQRIYENEISRMQDTIENSRDAREVTAAIKRKEKLTKQLQETKEYDEKIAHLALARISIDLDDGVKVNYEKVQTDADGKKLNVLAKI